MSSAAITDAVHGRPALSTWGLGAALSGAALVTGLIAGALTVSGRGPAVFGFGLVALLVFLWQRPRIIPVVVLVTALTIEQFPLTLPSSSLTGARASDLTDRIPFFRGLAPSLHINPADLLVLTLLVICLLKSGTSATNRLPRSPVTTSMGVVLLAVLIGLVLGQAHHGSLRFALTEIRPYAYLASAYFIASVFTTKVDVIRWLLWGLVIASGLKAVQAIVGFLKVHNENPRPDFVVGHEEAVFFGLFIIATLALWLFEIRGRLRTTATLLLPVVIVGDLVNTRRAAWLILGGALIVFAVIGLVSLPSRRRFLRRALTVLAVISIFYFPAYWNHTGSLAGPARAVHSAIKPNTRDELSDLYRVQENANLKLNIKQGGFLGKGFGVPIDYALPIANINSIDPLIAYVPHDGVFYIFMRMGLLGGIAFWSLLGAAIISGCRLSKSANREVACFGALVACAVVGYALEGYNDQGFFMYRIAFAMGCLLGVAEAVRVTVRQTEAAAPALEPAVAAPVRAIHDVPAVQPRRARPPVPARANVARPRHMRVITVPAERLPAATGRKWALEGRVRWLARGLLPFTLALLVFVSVIRTGHHATPASSHTTRFAFTAAGDTATLQVRRGSARGPLEYSGSLHGNRVVLEQRAPLWLQIPSGSAVVVEVNQKRGALRGPIEAVISSSGWRRVGP